MGGQEPIYKVKESHLLDLIWMARRYADGRMTYAVSQFNDIYDSMHIDVREKDQARPDPAVTVKFPHAHDGMWDTEDREIL